MSLILEPGICLNCRFLCSSAKLDDKGKLIPDFDPYAQVAESVSDYCSLHGIQVPNPSCSSCDAGILKEAYLRDE